MANLFVKLLISFKCVLPTIILPWLPEFFHPISLAEPNFDLCLFRRHRSEPFNSKRPSSWKRFLFNLNFSISDSEFRRIIGKIECINLDMLILENDWRNCIENKWQFHSNFFVLRKQFHSILARNFIKVIFSQKDFELSKSWEFEVRGLRIVIYQSFTTFIFGYKKRSGDYPHWVSSKIRMIPAPLKITANHRNTSASNESESGSFWCGPQRRSPPAISSVSSDWGDDDQKRNQWINEWLCELLWTKCSSTRWRSSAGQLNQAKSTEMTKCILFSIWFAFLFEDSLFAWMDICNWINSCHKEWISPNKHQIS